MEVDMKFLFTKQKNWSVGCDFQSSKFKFFDLQSQKILNFSNFTSDFHYIVSFKRYIKKISIFLLKFIILNF